MSFERRETILGLPLEKWKTVPMGTDTDEFTGFDSVLGIKPGKTIKVEITTTLPAKDFALIIHTKTKVADSWTSYQETNSTRTLKPEEGQKVRIFTVTAGHQVVYRWNGKK